MARAVQFGAGNIGRGLVGYVLRRHGYDVTFVDVVDEVVAQLNALGRYPVRILTRDSERVETVDGVRALHAADVDAVTGAVAGAQLVTTAVGPGVLPAVAEPIREGLRRHPAAAGAYVGAQRGQRGIDEAMQDSGIRRIVDGVATEAVAALQHRHPGFARQELMEYAGRSLARFSDPRLRDPIARVARDPLRKLGAAERLCGPARAAIDAGLPARHLATVIAAVLQYRAPDDPSAVQLAQDVKRQGWRAVLMRTAELPADHPLLDLVAEAQRDRQGARPPRT